MAASELSDHDDLELQKLYNILQHQKMRLNAYPANEITANLFKHEVLHLLYFMYHHKEKIPQLRWKALHEVTSLLVSDKFNHPSHQGSAGAWYFHDPLKKLEKEVYAPKPEHSDPKETKAAYDAPFVTFCEAMNDINHNPEVNPGYVHDVVNAQVFHDQVGDWLGEGFCGCWRGERCLGAEPPKCVIL